MALCAATTAGLGAQHFAFFRDPGHETTTHGWFRGDAIRGHAIEAPYLRCRSFIPKIALGRRQARGPIIAARGGRKPHSLRADAHRAQPLKGIAAPRTAAECILTETRAREFHTAFEGEGIALFRRAQIPKLQGVAVVQIKPAVAFIFHQDAAGARIADIKHQIDIDGFIGTAGGHHINQLHARQDARFGQQFQKRDVARPMFAGALLILRTRATATCGAHVLQDFLKPLDQPGFIHEPACLFPIRHKGEFAGAFAIGG